MCVCVHVSCWFCVLRELFKLFDKRTLINHILLYVLICKMIQKSTDRIFQLHGVPALLAPANLLYRFD